MSATSDSPDPPRRTLLDRWRGWRGIIGRSVLATCLGLALNIALLVYGARLFDVERQSTILYTGSCRTVALANTAAHAGINVIATLLVSAASNTINYLTAPSREDLDRLHANGDSVQVGVWDLRNWKVMSGLRRVLFVCAIVSSVPLHLFYNSIITTTYVPDDWAGFVVPPAFLEAGATWDSSLLNSTWPEAVPVLNEVQKNATTGIVQRFDADDCKNMLQPSLVLNYSTVLFVAATDDRARQPLNAPSIAMQHDSISDTDEWLVATSADSKQISNFTVNHYDWLKLWNDTSTIARSHPRLAANLSAIEYCLFQPQPEECSIQLVPQLIVPMVLFNILGALAGSVLFFHRSFQPLATLGDVISSFLTRAASYSFLRPLTDIKHGRIRNSPSNRSPSTNHIHRLLSRVSISKKKLLQDKMQDEETPDTRWYPTQLRWHSAVSRGRWVWTSLLFTLYWLSGLISIIIVLARSGNALVALSQGLTGPYSASSTTPPLIYNYNNPLGNIVLANVFQLILATNYLFYQNILARMALGAEFSRLTTQRNTLRVSNPTGDQRAGYWFTIPHRLALALLAVSALLHFLVSEAVYYEQLHPRLAVPMPEDSTEFPTTFVHAVICNPEALLIFEAVGLLAPAAAFAFGWLRRFSSQTPLVTGDSLVISALSTHRHEVRGRDEVQKPLQWGVIEESPQGGYVGFSSDEVQPLKSGKVYQLRYLE